MKMRTIEAAAAEVKQTDPNTALTKTALRRLVISGTIPSVRVGTKYLVALENVESFLTGEPVEESRPSVGAIRPVGVQ